MCFGIVHENLLKPKQTNKVDSVKNNILWLQVKTDYHVLMSLFLSAAKISTYLLINVTFFWSIVVFVAAYFVVVTSYYRVRRWGSELSLDRDEGEQMLDVHRAQMFRPSGDN